MKKVLSISLWAGVALAAICCHYHGLDLLGVALSTLLAGRIATAG